MRELALRHLNVLDPKCMKWQESEIRHLHLLCSRRKDDVLSSWWHFIPAGDTIDLEVFWAMKITMFKACYIRFIIISWLKKNQGNLQEVGPA